MERRSSAWIAGLAVVAIVIAGGTWIMIDRGGSEEDAEPIGDPVADEAPSWLFSHTADAGTLTENPDGTYELTLTGIDPNVMAFTDRPDRQTAIIGADHLVDGWPSIFADSAPNAVLVEHTPDGATDSLVLVLTEPRLEDRTLSFTADVLEDEAHPSGLDGMVGEPHATPPSSFSAASLFIDDVNMDESGYACLVNGQAVTPPGFVPIYYKPIAPFAKVCDDAGGTVTFTVTGTLN